MPIRITAIVFLLLSTLKSDMLPLTQRYFHGQDQGHDYSRGTYMIILSDPSLETYLTDDNTGNFVEFKQTQGYDVVVQNFDDIASGEAQYLKSYLQYYYEEQDSMLEYVLLVGDVDGNYAIPSFIIGSYNEFIF